MLAVRQGARNRVTDALAVAQNMAAVVSTEAPSDTGVAASASQSTSQVSEARVSADAEKAEGGSGKGKRKVDGPELSSNKTAKMWDSLAMLEGDDSEDSEEDTH